MLVRGRWRKGRGAFGTTINPVLLFDSELGPENGLRPKLTNDWQTFELFRPISAPGVFRISLALTGPADVHLDDLEIQKLPPIASRNPLRLTGDEVVVP